MYETNFFIYERNLNGDYDNVEPYHYSINTENYPTGKNIKDIIFEACEIERIPDGKILVDITTDKDGEFVNHDESEFEITIIRTAELSNFIKWDKCPNLPPIYKVDKEKSKLNIII